MGHAYFPTKWHVGYQEKSGHFYLIKILISFKFGKLTLKTHKTVNFYGEIAFFSRKDIWIQMGMYVNWECIFLVNKNFRDLLLLQNLLGVKVANFPKKKKKQSEGNNLKHTNYPR